GIMLRALPLTLSLSLLGSGCVTDAAQGPAAPTAQGPCTSPDPDPAAVSVASLLDRMIDAEALASWPQPAHCAGQWSSYERSSVAPGDESWFANRDRGHYLGQLEREGRTEYIMAEVEGPGALVRIWSANPSGTIRVYLDSD